MAHRADILAPACAWADSTQPKKRSRSIASRVGNAIRALKPGVRKEERSTEEKIYSFEADAMTQVEECLISKHRAFSEDDISTQSGGDSSASGSRSLSPAESFEEAPSLPGWINDSEVSLPSKSRKSELDDLALVIADRARSKFSGRTYQDVRNAFLAVDIDGDGKLNQEQLVAFCQHFDLSSQVALRFFNLLDRHKTGFIDWSSFMAKYANVFNKKTDFQLNSGASIFYV